MNTAARAEGLPTLNPPSRQLEHRFYTGYLVLLVALVAVGFAPSFFLRGVVEPFAPLRPLRPIVIAHGLVTAAWMVLFPLQAWLISTNRWNVHRQMGVLGFALGALMTATAYLLAMGLYREPAPPGFSPAMAIVLPLSDALTLLVLLPLAWRWRTNGQAHKRLMVIIACLLASAAIFRLPFGDRTSLAGILGVHLVLFAALLPLWAWDLLTRRRLHKATTIGSGIVAVDMFGRLFIAPTTAWASFVAALPGFG